MPVTDNLLRQRIHLPGHFSEAVQVEAIRPLGSGFESQVRRPRNPLLADAFKRTGLNNRQARYQLQKLTEQGDLELVGSGRGAYYRLPKSGNEQ